MGHTLEGFEVVARVEDVPDGELLGVEKSNGDRICLVNCDGEIRAVSDNCTHQDFPMSAGLMHPGCVIECAWHGAMFDCRSGAVLRMPAVKPLPTYEVVVQDGEILVGPRKP